MDAPYIFDYKSPGLQFFYYVTDGPVKLVPHSHSNRRIELWCLLQGKATMLVEDTEYPLSPGDLVVIRSGEVHTPVVDTSVPFGRASVVFDPSLFDALCENDSLWEPAMHHKPGTQNLYRAQDMERDLRFYYNQMRKSAKDPRLNILLNILLIMRHLNNAYSAKNPSNGTAGEPAQKILQYIGSHLHEELSLQSICQALYISSAQLERTVKKATGVSVGKYIAAKRLSLARDMILEGQRPTRICAACGYPNYASFFRAYTKYFGHTPKQELSMTQWEALEAP